MKKTQTDIAKAVVDHERLKKINADLIEEVKDFATKVALDGCACYDGDLCRFHERIEKLIARAEGRE